MTGVLESGSAGAEMFGGVVCAGDTSAAVVSVAIVFETGVSDTDVSPDSVSDAEAVKAAVSETDDFETDDSVASSGVRAEQTVIPADRERMTASAVNSDSSLFMLGDGFLMGSPPHYSAAAPFSELLRFVAVSHGFFDTVLKVYSFIVTYWREKSRENIKIF